MKMRVWWVPQLPMLEYFTVDVETVEEGGKLLNILADYDAFQYKHKIKPDYCNAGGLQILDVTDLEDGPEGSWCDWYDEETGEDDPQQYLEQKGN